MHPNGGLGLPIGLPTLCVQGGEKRLSKYLNSKVVEHIPNKNKCLPLHMAQEALQKIEWKDCKWLLVVRLAAK